MLTMKVVMSMAVHYYLSISDNLDLYTVVAKKIRYCAERQQRLSCDCHKL